MESSFAWRYANAREGKFQFRLRQDTTKAEILYQFRFPIRAWVGPKLMASAGMWRSDWW